MVSSLLVSLIFLLNQPASAEPAAAWPGPCVETRYWNGSFVPGVVFRYQYGAGDQLIRRNGTWFDGRQVTTRFLYEDGFLVKEEDSDGGWAEYYRDGLGKLWGVESGLRQFGEEFAFKWTHLRNAADFSWVDVDLDGDDVPDQQIRQRWENGRMVQRTVFKGEQIVSDVHNTYDESGRLQRSTVVEAGTTVVWSFLYDSAGNLLEKNREKARFVFDYGCWTD